MIDHGRIVLDAAADDVRGSAATVSGSPAAVTEFVGGRPILDSRTMASQESVVVVQSLNDFDRARDLHLRVVPLSLQQLVVHAADRSLENVKEMSA